jgi:AraC-like DNA-binding protein
MPSEAADFARHRFSLAAMPVQERVPFWREMFGRTVIRADIEPLSEDGFNAEASLRALPGLRTVSCTSSLARIRRTRELAGDGDDDLALVINSSGMTAPSQLGREPTVGLGEAVLALNAEPSTMLYSHVTAAVLVPRAALAPLVSNIEDRALHVIPHDNEALRLLVSYVDSFPETLTFATPELRHLTVTHVYDLMALALGATRDGAAVAEQRGLRAARLAAIKGDVIADVGDRNLSVNAVAARHQVSPRYVQRLFEDEGTTFSQFVLERRLSAAHRMLSDPRQAGMTISAIALAAGFGDLSHFNRHFRRRYGATPSDVRTAGRGG